VTSINIQLLQAEHKPTDTTLSNSISVTTLIHTVQTDRQTASINILLPLPRVFRGGNTSSVLICNKWERMLKLMMNSES